MLSQSGGAPVVTRPEAATVATTISTGDRGDTSSEIFGALHSKRADTSGCAASELPSRVSTAALA
jgi:hypothetical protein